MNLLLHHKPTGLYFRPPYACANHVTQAPPGPIPMGVKCEVFAPGWGPKTLPAKQCELVEAQLTNLDYEGIQLAVANYGLHSIAEIVMGFSYGAISRMMMACRCYVPGCLRRETDELTGLDLQRCDIASKPEPRRSMPGMLGAGPGAWASFIGLWEFDLPWFDEALHEHRGYREHLHGSLKDFLQLIGGAGFVDRFTTYMINDRWRAHRPMNHLIQNAIDTEKHQLDMLFKKKKSKRAKAAA